MHAFRTGIDYCGRPIWALSGRTALSWPKAVCLLWSARDIKADAFHPASSDQTWPTLIALASTYRQVSRLDILISASAITAELGYRPATLLVNSRSCRSVSFEDMPSFP